MLLQEHVASFFEQLPPTNWAETVAEEEETRRKRERSGPKKRPLDIEGPVLMEE